MGWETDQPPIPYLERRVKYYKKKITAAKGWPKMDFFIKKYGRKEIKAISSSRVAYYEGRILEFQKAVEILKSINNAGA